MTIKKFLAGLTLLFSMSVLASASSSIVDEQENISPAVTHAIAPDDIDSFFTAAAPVLNLEMTIFTHLAVTIVDARKADTSDDKRLELDNHYQQILRDMAQVPLQVLWKDIALFDASTPETPYPYTSFVVTSDLTPQKIQINLPSLTLKALNFENSDIKTVASAQDSFSKLQIALSNLQSFSGHFQNALLCSYVFTYEEELAKVKIAEQQKPTQNDLQH